MDIKRCTKERVETLREISIQTFVSTFEKDNKPQDIQDYVDRNLNAKTLISELENPDSFFYLLFEQEKVLGYLKLNIGQAQSEYQYEDGLEIERIYLLPEAQGKKAGQALMDFAIDQAYKHHKKRIWLGVWENNQRALAFYQKNEFRQVGQHIFYMGDDPQTDLIYERKLV